MPGTTDRIFAEHRQNDVPLMLGSNSDEGSNFPTMKTLTSFRDDARQTLGPLSDEFLRVYAANDDAQAAKASAAAVRDMRISWPNLQWAKAQARTGQSKLFFYYFQHSPPAPPEEHYVENLGKDLGSYHGAELAYVFGNFVPREWAWTQEDRDFARTMSRYWVNFATTGDPNGAGLPGGRCSIRRRAPCCIWARRSSGARSPTRNTTRSGMLLPRMEGAKVKNQSTDGWRPSHVRGWPEIVDSRSGHVVPTGKLLLQGRWRPSATAVAAHHSGLRDRVGRGGERIQLPPEDLATISIFCIAIPHYQ